MTKYGTDVLIAVALIALLFVGLAIWSGELWIRIVLIGIALFLVGFSLNFFRDPDRTIASNGRGLDSLVVSPADGKIVIVKEAEEPEYLHATTKMISIFMSPLDVHVNRAPMSGVVEYLRHVKGEFLNASTEASSRLNERTLIGLNTRGRKILFAQVAGYIARRIVCPIHEGDTLKAGERFGMIKFGSRVDVFLPLEARVLVHVGDAVRGGETILAELP